ncbi:g5929 [Coccomyxa viridis]|uniref:G5929 protein n=1 Tax=Coccomyxa viridis TaxID=1274662 RepID=A0ABP1FZ88_9CHLO
MADEVRAEITRILRSAGLTPAQARNMSLEELVDKFDENDGDAEDAEAEQKHQALKNQREGEAPYIAATVPQKMEGWVISFATLPTINKDTATRMWVITIYCHPGSYLIGDKYVVGRPTAKDCILALQVTMAYPWVGKARRPMTLLLAWRMKDMLDELDGFCMMHGILPRHETLEEAQKACQEHDTDVNGHNHPMDNVEAEEEEEVSEVEKLREEGNEFFVSRKYQKALTKYSEALQLDESHAPLYSNRSICYLRLGCADKAIADADEAIRLKPEWQKPYARKAEALRAQGKLADVQKLYEDCIKQFKHNAYFQDALAALQKGECKQ